MAKDKSEIRPNKILLVLLLLVIGTSVWALGQPEGIIEIRERMFVQQIDDIHLNTRDYLGRTIKYEGILMVGKFPGMTENFYMVYRNVPGGNCCVPFFGRAGFDGMSGFEVRWLDPRTPMPEHNAWVEATGVVRQNSDRSIYIELASLNELEIRGLENIYVEFEFPL